MAAPESYVHKDTPLPSLKRSIVTIDNKKVLFFSVPKGTDHVYVTVDGKCLQRKDLESVPIPPKLIETTRQEQMSREYDRQFVDGATLGDISLELIDTITQSLVRITPEKFLQFLNLAEFDGGRIHIKRAALLLFAKEAIRWHPRLQVRVIRVNGTEILSGEEYNVINDETVSDNIIRLIDKSWDLLRPYLVETKFSKDAVFRNQVMYPELACREALINAIAHRDYSNEGRGIEVYVFHDRIEFLSPGELLSSISIVDLKEQKGVHQSRNTLIARTLTEIGFMRELGEGFRRIFSLFNENELVPPSLISENGYFKVIMAQKTVYSKEENLWLSNFADLNLNKDERAVVRLGCKGEILSPQVIWDTVGIVDTDYYRQLLESLRRKKVLYSKVSKTEATNIARKRKIDKKRVERFVIRLPGEKEDDSVKPLNLLPRADMIENSIDDSDYAILFIRNVPYSATNDDLTSLFSTYGEVDLVRIPLNHETGKPRGFAFIEFDKKEGAEKAYSARHAIQLHGRKLAIERYKPRNI